MPDSDHSSEDTLPSSSSGHWYSLDDRALIRISGEDADTFLQGQLTSDVDLLGGGQQLSAWCNPRGRVIAMPRLWRDGEAISMQIPAALIDTVLPRMGMYILRSKVEMVHAPEEKSIGQTGAAARSWLEERFGKLPVSGQGGRYGQIYVHSLDEARFMLTAPREDLDQLVAEMPFEPGESPLSGWHRQEIDAGIPDVGPEISEELIPQSLNLDLLGAVSFSKGCYTGQEIVARTHYLGTPKQRLFRACIDNEQESVSDIGAGASLFYPDQDSRRCGIVVSVAKSETGAALLASVKLDAVAEHGCRLGSAQGPELEFLDSVEDLPEDAGGGE